MSDEVGKRHSLYTKNSFMWKSVRDAIEGSNAVKRMNEVYLPMPAGFEIDSVSPTGDPKPRSVIFADQGQGQNASSFDPTHLPYYHPNSAYMSYLQRARFPELTINTLRGLVGVAARNTLEIKLPNSISYLEDTATKKGDSLKSLFSYCLSEVLSQGRMTLVVDVDANKNEVRLVPYSTENYINWLDDLETGENELSVFEEKSFSKSSETFEEKEEVINIVYSWELQEGTTIPLVCVRRFVDGTEDANGKVNPTLQGKFFEKIPVVSMGSLNNSTNPDPAPLFGISEIAYSIYRKDADLSQSQYMTCNPMFVITGAVNEAGVPTAFGSTVALVLPSPDSNAFFTQTDTSGLNHVKESINELKEEASDYGATLLGPTKKAAEAVETVKMRQGAQGATLVGVVNNVSEAFEEALKIAAQISGGNPDQVEFSLPTDFAEMLLSPQMLTALVGAWQAGVYSKESLIEILIENGFARGEVEDEISRIFNEEPSSSGDD